MEQYDKSLVFDFIPHWCTASVCQQQHSYSSPHVANAVSPTFSEHAFIWLAAQIKSCMPSEGTVYHQRA